MCVYGRRWSVLTVGTEATPFAPVLLLFYLVLWLLAYPESRLGAPKGSFLALCTLNLIAWCNLADPILGSAFSDSIYG